jgi:hypothetical protein
MRSIYRGEGLEAPSSRENLKFFSKTSSKLLASSGHRQLLVPVSSYGVLIYVTGRLSYD